MTFRYQGVVVYNMSDVPLVRASILSSLPCPTPALPCLSLLFGLHLDLLIPRIFHDLGTDVFFFFFFLFFFFQGFGVAARTADETRSLDPTAIVAFHQGDVGEYLREEDSLT